MGTFRGSRVCLKEAEPWRYAIKDNDENLAFLLCIFNCYKYYLLLLLCIYGICVWRLDIHTTYHTWMEVRRQVHGVSSLTPHLHGFWSWAQAVGLCRNVIRYKVISLTLFFNPFTSQLPGEAQNPLPHVLCYDVMSYDIPKATKPVYYWFQLPKRWCKIS